MASELTPAQLAAAARAPGLDFVAVAVAEHDTTATHDAWAEQAGDDLLVILGQEVTTADGHWLALGLAPGQRLGGGIDEQRAEARRGGGLCVAAHPHAPYPSGTLTLSLDGFDVIEVWNGRWRSDLPWNADNEATLADWERELAAGRHPPIIGNSDTHLAGQIAVPHTVVLAPVLTGPAILAALRAGRGWIAGSRDIRLTLTATAGVHGATFGETPPLDHGAEVTIHADIQGIPGGTVTLHTEHGPAHRGELPSSGAGSLVRTIDQGRTALVRLEVRHAGGDMAALTNPVFLR